MIIQGSMDEFVNNYTLSILKTFKDVQLWQFSVSNANSYNIKKELYELENNNIGIWSKPANYDKHKDKNNILLITDKENTYVMLFNEHNSAKISGRKWWENIHKENGIIQIKLLGILNYGNEFQPIKKVNHIELINNLESFRNLS